ncbi:MAG TPA: CoA ester lyase [Vicinamibacteria bacterium]|nr:CoA ester lyase [Vicinamibacteria bacterium]
MNERLRRSLLYVPASSEPMLRKAQGRGADVLIVDLEDGVLPEAKPTARSRAQDLWPELAAGRSEVLLRINAAGTPWHGEDLETAARIHPAAVVVPKCEELRVIDAIGRRLMGLPLFLMVETARGVLACAELARAPLVAGLVFGAADFRASTRAVADPEESELLLARSSLVLAARAAGVEAIDTPCFDYRDEAGLERSARRARALGFDGKTAIHPGQLPAIHSVFSPTAAEVARAQRVIAALDEAAAAGRGVAGLDGEMLEALHGEEARRTLARARLAGLL